MTTAGAVFLLQLFHISVPESIFYGFLISLSSTAVVLKIYSDRGETDAPHGNIAIGILLFQDIGMLLNFKFVWVEKLFILVLVLSIFFLKSFILFLIVRFLKYPTKTALLVALSLAQIGEFSFVLANVGRANGLLPERIFQAFRYLG